MSNDAAAADGAVPTTDTPPPATEAELRAEITRTRAQLGENVDALTEKLDVKAQAGQKVSGVTDRVGQQARRIREKLPRPVTQTLDRAAQSVAPPARKLGDRLRPYRAGSPPARSSLPSRA